MEPATSWNVAGDFVLLTSQFAAAAAFLILAGLLLLVRFNSRVNRAFAIFLLLRGMHLLLLALGRLETDPTLKTALLDSSFYFALAVPFVLLYFVLIYRSPLGGVAVRAVGAASLLVILLLELVFLADHCAVGCGRHAGPLFVVVQSIPLAQALAGFALAMMARELRDSARGRAAGIVAGALALLGLLEGAAILELFVANGWSAFTAPFEPSPWIKIARSASLVAVGVALAALAVLFQSATTSRHRRLVVAAAACVLAIAASLAVWHSDEQVPSTPTFLFGLWRVVAACMVAYALVRHRFLDLDLRINWTISRGTVLAILVATFLVVSKIIENALNSKLGVIFGGVATGFLMLAIKPLERLGDRVATGILPRGRVERLEQEQRLEIFREQAMMVWSDGTMGRKERLLLDNLRERLGIEAPLAAQIEHEAASHAPLPSKSLELST